MAAETGVQPLTLLGFRRDPAATTHGSNYGANGGNCLDELAICSVTLWISTHTVWLIRLLISLGLVG